MAKRKRRSFTPEYKAEAVRLVREGSKIGKSIGQIARELDLTETSLRQWFEREEKAGEATGTTAPLSDRDELERLRKEVRFLRMERDILKKAAAFFAKENT
jgi:transposase